MYKSSHIHQGIGLEVDLLFHITAYSPTTLKNVSSLDEDPEQSNVINLELCKRKRTHCHFTKGDEVH
jgi:hypothetical protein